LPIQAAFAASRLALPSTQQLSLDRDDAGRFRFTVQEVQEAR